MGKCELTGKRPAVKNLVSHSNIKTKSIAMPNIQKKRLFSRGLNKLVTLRVAASTIRSIEHQGGLDNFIMRADDETMSVRALDFKKALKAVMKKRA